MLVKFIHNQNVNISFAGKKEKAQLYPHKHIKKNRPYVDINMMMNKAGADAQLLQSRCEKDA
uniref:Uncharacterized protein n=1 Tax=Romanomermis culicivorax TaxID=13658 RepID=A0A915IRN6_ROMCU